MKYRSSPRLPGGIAQIVLGTYGLRTREDAARVLDAYRQRGGNCVDTAYVYGDGLCERLLGQWMQDAGVRHDMVVITKGAHIPECYPETIARQLDESLDRLRTDSVDIYLLHRDNPDVAVGEFVQALADEQRKGRVRAVGVSNWTIGRVQEANRWAWRHNVGPVACLSNQFSLAEMLEPPWPGCVCASDQESVRWLRETSTALFPWSSQAQGFFARDGIARVRASQALSRSWLSAVNLERLSRARELARTRRTTAFAVALAYVLTQPFPAFPLIGPLSVEELDGSLAALEVELTPDDVAWLAGGTAAAGYQRG